MTTQKTFKCRIRARAAKTGESFTTARAQLLARADRNVTDRTPKTPASTETTQAPQTPEPEIEMPNTDEALMKATGHGWEHWLGIVDAFGGADRQHREIARYLVEEHGVDGWWSQSITVGFERARGLRAKHERPGQGFYVSSTATINVPLERLAKAVLDAAGRRTWLPAGLIRGRTVRPGKSGTYDWTEPPSRLTLGVEPKGPTKSQVWLEHGRLPDAATAAKLRTFWKARLRELKAHLEG
jgi:hypothetical protein